MAGVRQPPAARCLDSALVPGALPGRPGEGLRSLLARALRSGARAARRPRFAPLAQIVHGPFFRPQVPMHFSTTGGVWEGLPFEVP